MVDGADVGNVVEGKVGRFLRVDCDPARPGLECGDGKAERNVFVGVPVVVLGVVDGAGFGEDEENAWLACHGQCG